MVEKALRTKNVKMVERHTAMARQGYDIIRRLSLRMKLSEVQSPHFEKGLAELKIGLGNLGEEI